MADQKDPFQNAVLTEAKEPESMAGARLSGPASKYGVGGSSRVHPVVGGQKEMDLSDEEEQEELMQETFAGRTQSTARFNVSPHSWSTQVWDAFMAVLLIFVAIWTPAEVSFVEVAGGVTPLFVLNRVVDSCFCVDMVRQFFIPFYDEVRSPRGGGAARTGPRGAEGGPHRHPTALHPVHPRAHPHTHARAASLARSLAAGDATLGG